MVRDGATRLLTMRKESRRSHSFGLHNIPPALTLRSAKRVSKGEATAGASWFETALPRLLTMRKK
jgi:hypothetical protein